MRQAAPRRFEVFNLLSGRKQAAVSDGINGVWGAEGWRGLGCGKSAWVRWGGVVGLQSQAPAKPLASERRRHGKWKEVVGVVCF